MSTNLKNKSAFYFSLKGFSLMLVFIIMSGFSNKVQAGNLSDSAVIYYEKNQFDKAAACYERILADGMESWILHYNLGNAYFKANKIGQSILHYEIAKKINPQNQDVLNNLKIAESKVVDKVDTKQFQLRDEIRDFFIYKLSTTGWAWLSVALLFSALFLFYLFYILQSPASKRFSFWSGLVVSISFVVALICGFSALSEKNAKVDGVIIAREINVYNSPREENSNKKATPLHEGTKVKVLNTEQDWINIQLANGNEGWVKSGQVAVY
jgi:tetratricopeptide (TPR) repeat protein